ncbi:hypothetical protein INR49_024496 [Caranx melampygus]|nr:hypothetical protein INR49_024496 [Caranx melampygus]
MFAPRSPRGDPSETVPQVSTRKSPIVQICPVCLTGCHPKVKQERPTHVFVLPHCTLHFIDDGRNRNKHPFLFHGDMWGCKLDRKEDHQPTPESFPLSCQSTGGFRSQTEDRKPTTIKGERRNLASVALLIFSYAVAERREAPTAHAPSETQGTGGLLSPDPTTRPNKDRPLLALMYVKITMTRIDPKEFHPLAFTVGDFDIRVANEDNADR